MPLKLEIRLLGGVFFTREERPLPAMPSRTARALFLFLACQPHPIPRERLMAMFWPESEPAQAAANLRSLLSVLKKNFAAYLLITRHDVGFNHASDYALDIDRFEQGMAGLEPVLAEMTAPTPGQIEGMEEVLALYQGDFLAGFSVRDAFGFEEWVMLERERLGLLAATGLRRLVAHYLDHRHYDRGLAAAVKLLALDDLNEEAHRQMMWLLARRGQRNGALKQYLKCKAILRDELDVAPAPATTALYDRLQALTFPPPVRLPHYGDPFFGREAEMTRLQALLTGPDSGPITIMGAGGIGKTRLANEAARAIALHQPGTFLDGVTLISLVALTSPEQIILTLAETLNLALHDAQSPEKQVLDGLKDREMLLILDNFEHLHHPDSLRFLSSLHFQCPGIRLLITSRERLNLPQEHVIDLGGLSCARESPLPAGKSEHPAVSLFFHHASKVRSDFALTPENHTAILDLCRLVDGLPLALQLAASLARFHDPDEIVAIVAQDMDALRRARPLPQDRHHSIRAVFDTSWRALSEAEQALLPRLAVFRNAFSLAAAEAITEATPALLFDLADKSLLCACSSRRFSLHPLLHQYLQTRLNAASEAEVIQRQHSRYFARLIQEKMSEMGKAQGQGQHPPQALAEIREHIDDLRAAWDWAISHPQQIAQAELIAFVDALSLFYRFESWYLENIALLSQALDLAVEAEVRGRWLRRLAQARFGLGLMQPSEDAFLQALEVLGQPLPAGERRRRLSMAGFLAKQVRRRLLPTRLNQPQPREHCPTLEAIHAYDALSRVYFYAGDRASFGFCILSALSLAEKINAWPAMARSYANMCIGTAFLHQLGWAEYYLENAHNLAERIHDAPTRAYVFLVTGVYDGMVGQWQRSTQSLLRAQDIYDRLGDHQQWSEATTVLSINDYALGRFEEARQRWQILARRSRQVGNPLHEAWGLSGQAGVMLLQARPAEAEQLARRAVAALTTLNAPQNLFSAQCFWALALYRSGRKAEAVGVIEEILISLPEMPLTFMAMVTPLGVLAELLLILAEKAEADNERSYWLRQAETVVSRLEVLAQTAAPGRPRALLYRGMLLAQSGQPALATPLWEASLSRAQTLSMPYDEARAHLALAQTCRPGGEIWQAHWPVARSMLEEMGAVWDLRAACFVGDASAVCCSFSDICEKQPA